MKWIENSVERTHEWNRGTKNDSETITKYHHPSSMFVYVWLRLVFVCICASVVWWTLLSAYLVVILDAQLQPHANNKVHWISIFDPKWFQQKPPKARVYVRVFIECVRCRRKYQERKRKKKEPGLTESRPKREWKKCVYVWPLVLLTFIEISCADGSGIFSFRLHRLHRVKRASNASSKHRRRISVEERERERKRTFRQTDAFVSR